MKRFLAILLALAALLTMAACGASQRDFDRDDREDKEDSGDKNVGIWDGMMGGQEDVPQVSPAPMQPPAQMVQLLFNLYNYDGETLAAEIAVYSDNTFEMKVNLFEGWGTIIGAYYVEPNNNITCTVEQMDFSGFHGDNLEKFVLEYTGDENFTVHLEEVDRLGMLDESDGFVRVAP